MLVTPLGMVIEVRLLHPLNVLEPILVMLFESDTEVKLLQPWYLQIALYQRFTS